MIIAPNTRNMLSPSVWVHIGNTLMRGHLQIHYWQAISGASPLAHSAAHQLTQEALLLLISEKTSETRMNVRMSIWLRNSRISNISINDKNVQCLLGPFDVFCIHTYIFCILSSVSYRFPTIVA